MVGDSYQVLTFKDDVGTTCAAELDSWSAARDKRNELFFGDEAIRSAWVMRVNRGLALVPSKYGHTLRRDKHGDRRAHS